MKRYTAGYTDFFGVSNDVYSADTLTDLYRDITGEANTDVTRSDIIQAVKKQESAAESAWVREAPLRMQVSLYDPVDGKMKRHTLECCTSLEDAVKYIITRHIEVADELRKWNFSGEDTHLVDGQECKYIKESNSVHIPQPQDLTINGVRDLMLRALEPQEQFKSADCGYDFHCLEIVPSPVFQVTMLADAAAKIDADLKEAVRKAHSTGIPQSSLAHLAGVSQPTIGRWVK